MQKSGLFIVLEGLDGSGKSTHSRLIKDYLEKMGKKVWLTAEPSEMPIGKLIRKVIRKEIVVESRTLALLFAADRTEHIRAKSAIKDLLASGTNVVCDRFVMSSLAYNSLNTDYNWVTEINRHNIDSITPDLQIYLDTDLDTVMKRIERRGEGGNDLFEKRTILTTIKQNYERALQEGLYAKQTLRIDSDLSIQEVSNRLQMALDACLTNQ